MDTGQEFRAFCPPAAALSVRLDLDGTASSGVEDASNSSRQARVTTISQYSWHASYRQNDVEKARGDAELVCQGAQDILDSILAHAASLSCPTVLETLREQGFVFDVPPHAKRDSAADRDQPIWGYERLQVARVCIAGLRMRR